MTDQAVFYPTEIPHFNEMKKETQEHVLIIPSYIAQMALAQKRVNELDDDQHSPAALGFTDAREGEKFLIQWMKIYVSKLVWEILLDYPLQQEIHPAITVVRDAELKPIDIQITEDLRPWLPVTSVPCGAG